MSPRKRARVAIPPPASSTPPLAIDPSALAAPRLPTTSPTEPPSDRDIPSPEPIHSCSLSASDAASLLRACGFKAFYVGNSPKGALILIEGE